VPEIKPVSPIACQLLWACAAQEAVIGWGW
jgi:hypothetical protein